MQEEYEIQTYQTTMVPSFLPASLLNDFRESRQIDWRRIITHSLSAFGQDVSLPVEVGKMKTCQESSCLDLG